METPLAPVVIFTYKRLDTLKKAIDSLLQCSLVKDTDVYIYSDGAKHSGDIPLVNDVRSYLRGLTGFKSKELIFAGSNNGLANSIINGVSDVLTKHSKVIVLEDDLILTPNFLLFMNAALNRYEASQRVFSISGYSFNLPVPPGFTDDAYFLNRGWSWGWATWRDRWEGVDWQVKNYDSFKNSPAAKRAFNRGGSDLAAMLEKQMTNKVDSWAIRWSFHQFNIQGLTLCPVYSKVLNVGFDELATHTTGSVTRYLPKLDEGLKQDFNLPARIEISQHFQSAFQRKMNIASRVRSKLASVKLNIIRYFKI